MTNTIYKTVFQSSGFPRAARCYDMSSYVQLQSESLVSVGSKVHSK